MLANSVPNAVKLLIIGYKEVTLFNQVSWIQSKLHLLLLMTWYLKIINFCRFNLAARKVNNI